ncbi:16S rRNA (guanine(527)-N(7))-methyltransferase RsmG [Luminiphilus sp.]|jgi:16S rRNA (guanine527-N7)-methyltransferase|nr:16S rRNA (guanine(527)-N(7))-methyltransferase RsmG [Luminiphilus sp.]MDA9988607.1 16S rRNA (guanine(527)-N(7))-methyltransferase RsmG [Luminiphilus sp.]MDB0008536.1 16S rRNA (guanine(527)-N(7))-methyltransferase RsmG [Luminiphilus sp.]
MVNSEAERLLTAAADIGIDLSDHQTAQLLSYLDLLEKWNNAYNLTAVRSRSEMLSRHLVESLAISPFISGKQVVDVGTGAGLPGIPLAIANPAVHYTLLDSNGKKSRFLLEVKRALMLSNVEIETVRVESWLPTKRFDSVVTRAFADLATTLVRVDHVLTDQGMVYAMKTQQAQHEIESLADATRQVTAQSITVPGRDWSFQLLAVQPRAAAL